MRKWLGFILLVAALSGCSGEPASSDIADYELWRAKSRNAENVRDLQAYLDRERVGQVIPLFQLLRSDTRWRKCGAEPFAVPPRELWPNIVPTLRTVRDRVIPRLGPVEALSVFRSPQINTCIGGASKSFHLQFRAIDMRLAKSLERPEFVRSLCSVHRVYGIEANMGLGIYNSTRFHIDAAGYRRWGADHHAASSPCRHFDGRQ